MFRRALCADASGFFFFSSRRRHTRFDCDWSSDVCSSDLLSGAVRRAVALAEQELDGRPNMVTLRELAVAADGDPGAPVITVVGQHGQTLARLRTAAVHFEDAATFFPMLGRWEVWQLINLTGDTHPIHVHLEPFHVLARRPIAVTVPGNGIGDRDTTATVRVNPTRSSSSPSASRPTAAATCTTATSSNTRTAT